MKQKLFILAAVVIIGGASLFILLQKSPATNQQTTTTNSTASTSSSVTPSTSGNTGAKKYTLAEISAHSTETDCWTAVNGKIYNVSAFIKNHEGGERSILEACGVDSTLAFQRERAHQREDSESMLDNNYLVGTLAN